MARQRIYLGIGNQTMPIEVLVNLVVEDNNRDDVYEVLKDTVDLIYDGEYETEDSDE